MVSRRVLSSQSKNVQGLLCTQICIQSFLGTRRLQVFHKGGYKHSNCPYGAWCGALSGFQLQTSGEPSILGAQELIKEAATEQGWAQWPTEHPSHSTLSLCPLLALCFSRRGWKGSRVTAPQGTLAHAGLRHPQLQGYLASGLRPGKRTGLRRVTSLASGSGSSVATATTVPACVGMLTVPKLGPPAQYLVGAVLPTATRHARGRVINFKPATQTGQVLAAGFAPELPTSTAVL